jgi:hypothetical protein
LRCNDLNANSFFENLPKTCIFDGKIQHPVTNTKENDYSSNGNNNN